MFRLLLLLALCLCALPVHSADDKPDRKALTKKAEAGDADAQYQVGLSYFSGSGLPQDIKKGRMWLAKAAAQGHTPAQVFLADFKAAAAKPIPHAVAKKAFERNTKAAEQGDADAQYQVGNAYDLGQGVAQDRKKAIEWYTKAAAQGHASAQNSIGAAYQFGWGAVRQDYKKAIEWYTKSAEQGNLIGQFNLATMYSGFVDAPPDYKKAVEWYTKAAEQGRTGRGWLSQYWRGTPNCKLPPRKT